MADIVASINKPTQKPGLFWSSFQNLAPLWRRYNSLTIGMLILLPFILFALVPNLFTHYDPIKISVMDTSKPPSAEHWFGTDELGRDVYSRVVSGSRISLTMALLTIALASSVGVIFGVIAGYQGGWIDRVIMGLVDMLLAFPSILLAMAVAAALGPNIRNAMLAVAMVWWPIYARLMRGLFLSLRTEAYVEAARSVGSSTTRIIWRHILPNALSTLIVRISLDVGYAVLLLASLGFIGLGASPPTPEWGAMVSWGRIYFLTEWWIGAFPGLAITLVVIGTTFLGDSLNDLLNPRL